MKMILGILIFAGLPLLSAQACQGTLYCFIHFKGLGLKWPRLGVNHEYQAKALTEN